MGDLVAFARPCAESFGARRPFGEGDTVIYCRSLLPSAHIPPQEVQNQGCPCLQPLRSFMGTTEPVKSQPLSGITPGQDPFITHSRQFHPEYISPLTSRRFKFCSVESS